jgi:hypothetical protein
LLGQLDGKTPFEDLGIDGRMILKWIFKKYGRGRGMNSSGSG